MRYVILFSILLLPFQSVLSQKVKKVSATYTYYAPETMSVEEAKRTALERAKIQAIADEFGTVVSQSTSTVVSNKNGELDTQFYSYGGSEVKGEWIETVGEPTFDISFENHFLVVICTVNGRAREIESAKVEFIATPLRNGTALRYESVEFRDGDDLYLYFSSPVDGCLAVYLLDEGSQTVFSILPYKAEKTPTTRIEGKKEYVFFSMRDAEKADRWKVDEYSLNCQNDKEFNTLYILFSPSEIGKKNGFNSDAENLPNNIPYKDFKQWLGKTLSKDPKIQFQEINITISK